jgi:hypothetical protein
MMSEMRVNWEYNKKNTRAWLNQSLYKHALLWKTDKGWEGEVYANPKHCGDCVEVTFTGTLKEARQEVERMLGL